MATPQQVFDAISVGIKSDPSVVSQVNGIFHFKVDDKSWTVDLKNDKGSVKQDAPEKADCTLITNANDFVALMTGKVQGPQLFMQGKLKIQGNMALAQKLEKIPRGPPSGTSPPASASASASTQFRSQAVFDELAKRISNNPDLVQSVGAVYQFNLTEGGKTQSWNVDLKNGKGKVSNGPASPKADCTLSLSDADFVGLMTGKLNAQQLFVGGKLKMEGNMGLAMKLSKLQQPKSSL